MGILIVALANFIVGSILGPSGADELSKGFFGYNRKEILITTILSTLLIKSYKNILYVMQLLS
jgi:hypothetical protein